jgi:hypothetical protein
MIKNLFLNVGAMKAGTSWLYEQLKNHPDIYSLPIKESHYFANVTGQYDFIWHERRVKWFFDAINEKSFDEFKDNLDAILWYANFSKNTVVNDEWYQSLFKNSQKKYCADFCNLNANLNEEGWRRVRQNFSGKLKVTYCLRDPLKRAWSHYKFDLQFNGCESEALNFKKLKAFFNDEATIKIARYDLAIERLRKHLSDDEFKIFYFEDFHESPQSTLNEICDFLEISKISRKDSDLKEVINPSKNIAMTAEIEDFLMDYLSPIYVKLDQMGMIHPSWRKFSAKSELLSTDQD